MVLVLPRTRKIEDIKENRAVLVTLPSREGEFYGTEGKATLESEETIKGKWMWWHVF